MSNNFKSPAFGTPKGATPSPDTLRLNRLDRLIDQLGEHQLTIRQQGVSVVDISDRLKRLETTTHNELQSLAPLRDLDVRGELTQARTCIDKLQRQLAHLLQEQEDYRQATERRFQAVEAKAAASESRTASLESQIEELRRRNIALLDELRQSTREAVSDVIDRVAEQFEVLQLTLDEAVGDREAEAKERAASAKLIGEALTVQRQWTEEQLQTVHKMISSTEESLRLTLDTTIESMQSTIQRNTSEKLIEQEHSLHERFHASLQDSRQEQQEAVQALESRLQNALSAVTQSTTANTEELKTAVSLWQEGLEEQMQMLVHKFDQYRGYVKKLKKEVEEYRQGQAFKSQKAQGEAAALLRDVEESIRAVNRVTLP